MPRPPSELRKLEEEERRRARVHRRLRWEQRLHASLWVLGGLGVLITIVLLARLVGLFFG
jgi:hypothetical protein